MIINGENLQKVNKLFKKEFTETLNSTPTSWEKVATRVKAGTPTVDYAWLGQFPSMRKWVGDRVIKDLKAHKYSITKERFESTIEVDRDYILYDNLGVIKPAIQEQARSAKTHYDDVVWGLLELNKTCYDGKKFFDSHKVGDNTISNKGTKPLTMDNFFATREAMMSLKGEEGKALGIKPNLLVVPPSLEKAALEIANSDTINGSTNIAKGLVEVLVVPQLNTTTGWYLLDTTRVIKPIILQVNKDIDLTAMDNPNDESVFMRASYRYGVDAEHNAGYGLWHLAYFNDGTK